MQLLRLDDVKRYTGLSSTSIWRLEKAGNFPKRRQIGPHSVAWLSTELTEWIESRPIVDTAHE